MFTYDEFCSFSSGGNNEVRLENLHNIRTALDPNKTTSLLSTRNSTAASGTMTLTVTVPTSTVTASTASAATQSTTVTHTTPSPISSALTQGMVQGTSAPGTTAGVVIPQNLLQQVFT